MKSARALSQECEPFRRASRRDDRLPVDPKAEHQVHDLAVARRPSFDTVDSQVRIVEAPSDGREARADLAVVALANRAQVVARAGGKRAREPGAIDGRRRSRSARAKAAARSGSTMSREGGPAACAPAWSAFTRLTATRAAASAACTLTADASYGSLSGRRARR